LSLGPHLVIRAGVLESVDVLSDFIRNLHAVFSYKRLKLTSARAGIGLGIALKYLSEGDDVVLVGRSLERLQVAIPPDFKGSGSPHFLAKDVSAVCSHPLFGSGN
jgi:hypothetical protein